MHVILRMWACGGLLFVFAVSCERRETPHGMSEQYATPSSARTIRSSKELRKLLPAGVDASQIIQLLGNPNWKDELGEGRSLWYYNLNAFPADDDMQGTDIVGATVNLTNGRLAHLGFAYDQPTHTFSRKDRDARPAKSHAIAPASLDFFPVLSLASGEARFIDTERFPRLGYVATQPALTILRLQELAVSERIPAGAPSRTNWTFEIFLTEEDALSLARITATNIGRHLLITTGSQFVSAPTIRAPLETGSLVIECEDRRLKELLKANFDSMLPETRQHKGFSPHQ